MLQLFNIWRYQRLVLLYLVLYFSAISELQLFVNQAVRS